MIQYNHNPLHVLCRIFQVSGSVFPKALLLALPCALLTAALTTGIDKGYLGLFEDEDSVLKDNAAWGGFSFLVGFLIVFRTSQSYSRFWDGCTSTCLMGAEWFDGCSALIAFCKTSKADDKLVGAFQNTLLRLFSMLHAAALADIEDSGERPEPGHGNVEFRNAFKYELLDVEGIDEESLNVLRHSHQKVELIFQWIQQLVCENITNGVLAIPPPILSRAFQENANGMVAFHDALKIATIPFPFPYTQSCDFLLLLHWLVAPFVVSQWVSEPFWAGVFSFTQVFILWALNFIAIELEHPFGTDANDIDGHELQLEMNEKLLLLLHPDTCTTPTLSSNFQDLRCQKAGDATEALMVRKKSFTDVWGDPRTSERSGDSDNFPIPKQITPSCKEAIPQIEDHQCLPDPTQLQEKNHYSPQPLDNHFNSVPLSSSTDVCASEIHGKREDHDAEVKYERDQVVQPRQVGPPLNLECKGRRIEPRGRPSPSRVSTI